jgi:hypothetical protein
MGLPDLTVSDLIDRLGGNPVVADYCGVSNSAVSNWRAWNRFPDRASLHYRLRQMCKEKRIRLPTGFLERMSDSGLAA